MSGEKCQCKTPQINHIDVKKIHGSTCVTCGKIILYPQGRGHWTINTAVPPFTCGIFY